MSTGNRTKALRVTGQKGPVQVAPIADDDLDEVCRFLSENMSSPYTTDEWRNAVDAHWTTDPPNHGFLLRDGARLAGVIGALYSRQDVGGRLESFCNIHGWYVSAEYRAHSLKLLLALLGQSEYHVTALTPNPEVAKIYQAMKFRPMEKEQRITFNIPRRSNGAVVVSDPNEIAQVLPKSAANVFREHQHLPLLDMVAVGRGDTYCLIVFKKVKKSRMRFAVVLHVDDVELFARYQGAFQNHLLLRHRILAFKIDSRFVRKPAFLSLRARNSAVRLFYSRTLGAREICGIYSELAVLP